MDGKLRIGINGRSMGGNIRDGISNVATNLFLNFPRNPEIEWFIFSPYEKLFPEIEAKGGFVHIHPEKDMRGGVWFYTKLIRDLRRHPVDIFWSPNQLLPPGIPKKTRTILTVHDFTFIKHPETMSTLCRWNLRLRGEAAIRKADVLVAVSKTTADDLKNIASPIANIKVIYNGIDPDVFFPEPLIAKSLIELDRPDYFLTVGSIEPRKNLGVILDAYEALFEETGGDCPRWVVVYSNKWKCKKLLNRMQEGKASKGIIMKRNVALQELRRLYSNAIALVFPSLYEGFGLPLVEAMACGCPVIASDIGICREICQEAACYVKQDCGKLYIRNIINLLDNYDLKKRYAYFGLRRSGFFRWEISAEMYFLLFTNFLSNGG